MNRRPDATCAAQLRNLGAHSGAPGPTRVGNLWAAVSEGTRLLRHLDEMRSLLDHLGVPELTDAQRATLDRELDGDVRATRPKRQKRAA